MNKPTRHFTVIFDFDGTLADTLYLGMHIYNHIATQLHLKTITEHDVERLRNKRGQDILKELGISLLKVPCIAKKLKSAMNKHINELKPKEGMVAVLVELEKNSIVYGVLTSNSRENVDDFARKNNITMIDFIYTGQNLFAKHKRILSLLKRKNLDPHHVVYVGDEIRDIEAAKKAHIKCIAVTWGFNSKERLKKHNPDFIVASPSELFSAIKQLTV